jgi:hypothetical protein
MMLLYGVALVLLLGVSVSDASEAVFHSDTVVNPVVDAGGERVDDVVKCASETRNLTFFHYNSFQVGTCTRRHECQ